MSLQLIISQSTSSFLLSLSFLRPLHPTSSMVKISAFTMDPCPLLSILVGNLALMSPSLLPSKSEFSLVHPSSPLFYKIKLENFPSQFSTVLLIPQEAHTSNDVVSFTLMRKDIEKLGVKGIFLFKESCLQILVYIGR